MLGASGPSRLPGGFGGSQASDVCLEEQCAEAELGGSSQSGPQAPQGVGAGLVLPWDRPAQPPAPGRESRPQSRERPLEEGARSAAQWSPWGFHVLFGSRSASSRPRSCNDPEVEGLCVHQRQSQGLPGARGATTHRACMQPLGWQESVWRGLPAPHPQMQTAGSPSLP